MGFVRPKFLVDAMIKELCLRTLAVIQRSHPILRLVYVFHKFGLNIFTKQIDELVCKRLHCNIILIVRVIRCQAFNDCCGVRRMEKLLQSERRDLNILARYLSLYDPILVNVTLSQLGRTEFEACCCVLGCLIHQSLLPSELILGLLVRY